MAVKKWVELNCDICLGTHSSLRWYPEIGARGLREEAKIGGWITRVRDGFVIDVCNLCKVSD